MRIIGGSARGRKLAPFDGKLIRPTPDRVREALFSLLTSRFGSLNGLKVLELFAGSGALSLEAVSRGACCALLIEQDPYAVKLIRENVSRCGFAEAVTLIRGELPASLHRPEITPGFDLILMDPPYGSGMETQILEGIENLDLLAKNGILCVETPRREPLDYQGTLKKIQDKSYGSTRLHLFAYPEE